MHILAILCSLSCGLNADAPPTRQFDLVILGGTPAGIMAAVAAAREGHSTVILERSAHIGGLPANGLGATDIGTRAATQGLFANFVRRVEKHYVDRYGPDSQQVKDASDGFHFEPSVAERVFDEMLGEHKDRITVLKLRQFDALPENVSLEGTAIRTIVVTERAGGRTERYAGRVFIDATYEGDLAAAAGAPFRLGREGAVEYREPMAGRLYKAWGGPVGPGSSGEADNAVQAYNYRVCLTSSQENMTPIPKPDRYCRQEYADLVEDVKQNRLTGPYRGEKAIEGIGRLVNMVVLPNGKTDANNQHLAFLSTDLPEENWPWPTSSWDWRDRFAKRQRDYTLGLLWFAQHDPALPEEFRRACLQWGLAKDEYADHGNFPRQIYVREGRRIEGEHRWTAHDALPVRPKGRPPLYDTSITASHYALDSHAVRKREPGRVHLDGFFSYPTRPYTVPYGVIVPRRVEGLLTPVAVSGTHIGFSTLRMEPCWMALGEAAGEAACVAMEDGAALRKIDVVKLQRRLLAHGAVLIHFSDAQPGDPHFEALQFFALRGFLGPDQWLAMLRQPVGNATAEQWIRAAGAGRPPQYVAQQTTRGELLDLLYQRVVKLPPEKIAAIRCR